MDVCVRAILISLALWLVSADDISDHFPGDFLTPYKDHYRTKRSLRFVRDCQPVLYGNVTHETYPASRNRVSAGSPFVNVRTFIHEYDKRGVTQSVSGHFSVLEDPLRTFSVLEPRQPGGCAKNVRSVVQESAEQRNCYLASNAGYFRTNNGACLGNIVSDGRYIQDSGGVQNANFGIRKDGTIVTGYLAEEDVFGSGTENSKFLQLVSGVLWIVRRGKIYVDESKKAECQDTQETGSMDLFANVVSARAALGHDKEGRVVFVQVDGKTNRQGINLYEFGKLLLKLGVVNAINLDGGGSATAVVNGTLVNTPSDICGDFTCAREVSTIVCAHEPDCSPANCSGNGRCQQGVCVCDRQWSGAACEELLCEQTNCSSNGICTKDGCMCSPGWEGDNCERACLSGWFGVACTSLCLCQHGAACDPRNGQCTCKPGWTGQHCDQACLPGTYGQDCHELCNCSTSCECHPETGQCSTAGMAVLQNSTQPWLQCFIKSLGNNSSEPSASDLEMQAKSNELEEEYDKIFIWFLGAVGLCGVSILANFFLICMQCHQSTRRNLWHRRRQMQEGESLFSPDTDEEL